MRIWIWNYYVIAKNKDYADYNEKRVDKMVKTMTTSKIFENITHEYVSSVLPLHSLQAA